MKKLWLGVLRAVLGFMSPALREALKITLIELSDKAANTSNPWDDLGVGILANVLGIDLDESEPK